MSELGPHAAIGASTNDLLEIYSKLLDTHRTLVRGLTSLRLPAGESVFSDPIVLAKSYGVVRGRDDVNYAIAGPLWSLLRGLDNCIGDRPDFRRRIRIGTSEDLSKIDRLTNGVRDRLLELAFGADPESCPYVSDEQRSVRELAIQNERLATVRRVSQMLDDLSSALDDMSMPITKRQSYDQIHVPATVIRNYLRGDLERYGMIEAISQTYPDIAEEAFGEEQANPVADVEYSWYRYVLEGVTSSVRKAVEAGPCGCVAEELGPALRSRLFLVRAFAAVTTLQVMEYRQRFGIDDGTLLGERPRYQVAWPELTAPDEQTMEKYFAWSAASEQVKQAKRLAPNKNVPLYHPRADLSDFCIRL